MTLPNYIKKTTKFLIISVATIILFGSFVGVTLAQSIPPVSVQFVPNPLFNNSNFLPKDETSGQVTATNNSGSTQTLVTEAINIADSDNFGSLLRLKIVGSSGTLFDNSLAYFFANAGEVSLGTISNGESKIFTYTVSFINSNDNSFQGKTLGFDICVRYQNSNTHCGNTTIGGEGNTGGGVGGDPGGGVVIGTSGGGGNGQIVPTSLIITNEKVNGISGGVEQVPTATALITWNTNKLATSQVVYGPNTTTYTFDVNNLPAFGYPFVTAEDSNKVILHSVLLTGLTPGQTYVYRVVSRASPPTVSFEHQFTIPLSDDGGNNVFAVNTGSDAGVGTGQGSVKGIASDGGIVDYVSVPEVEVSTALEYSTVADPNVAAAFMSGFGDILSLCSLIALIILILLYLVWKLWLRGRYEKNGVPEEEIKTRFFIFYGLATALVMVVLLVFGQYCPIPIILIAFVLSFFGYLYRLFFKVL